MGLRQTIARLLRRTGWNLHRHPAPGEPAHRRSVLLAHHHVDLVIDVGANTGQYAMELREYGYAGEIASVEPTAAAFRELARNASRDPAWTAIHAAAGAEAGTATINVAGNSVSSSILPMLDRHLTAAPASATTSTERVRIEPLDSIVADLASTAMAPFLKIDTQGFERAVLEGASTLLPSLVGIELELSLVALYEGQALWQEQIAYLELRGFRLAGVAAGFWDEQSGETLQLDGLFVAGDPAG